LAYTSLGDAFWINILKMILMQYGKSLLNSCAKKNISVGFPFQCITMYKKYFVKFLKSRNECLPKG
jgi:hypothetical protein